jgi:hypothetical protein
MRKVDYPHLVHTAPAEEVVEVAAALGLAPPADARVAS